MGSAHVFRPRPAQPSLAMSPRPHTTRWIRASYPGRCRRCGVRVGPGDDVLWSSRRRAVTCARCSRSHSPRLPVRSVADPYRAAGGGALREYRRRRARRADRLRQRFGQLGTLLSVVTEPTHLRVWSRGARGEQVVARRLAARLVDADVVLLHDRRLPQGRANFDHIAIGPAGVLVIDTKNLRGSVRRAGHGSGQRLCVGDHDRTTLVTAAQRQARSLARVLAAEGFAHVPVRAALCLARPHSLGLRSSTTVRGVLVGSPERIAGRARESGALTPERVCAVALVLARGLPPA